jgi:PadR family transcriptional regulator, regulatory protein PadR
MTNGLGHFEKLVLLAVAQLADAYGVTIRREIEEKTGRQVSAGAIYTSLERLESRGLVASELTDPTPVRGGRRKRTYRLRPLGERALEGSFDELRRMAQGLETRFRLS